MAATSPIAATASTTADAVVTTSVPAAVCRGRHHGHYLRDVFLKPRPWLLRPLWHCLNCRDGNLACRGQDHCRHEPGHDLGGCRQTLDGCSLCRSGLRRNTNLTVATLTTAGRDLVSCRPPPAGTVPGPLPAWQPPVAAPVPAALQEASPVRGRPPAIGLPSLGSFPTVAPPACRGHNLTHRSHSHNLSRHGPSFAAPPWPTSDAPTPSAFARAGPALLHPLPDTALTLFPSFRPPPQPPHLTSTIDARAAQIC